MSVDSATSGIASRSASTSVEIRLARVAPAHRRQHARRPGLHRQVQVLADLREVADRGDQPVGRRAADAGSRTGCARCRARRAPPRAAPRSRSRHRRAPGSDSRSGRAAGLRVGPCAAASRTSARISAFGRIRSWPRVYGTTQKLQILVAALDDRHPGAHRIAASRDAERKRDVVVRAEIDLRRGGPSAACVDQHRQHPGRAACRR